MRTRLVAAGVAAFMVLGGTVAYGAAASTDVACTITDNTLSCPLPAAPAPVTTTATVTADPVTVTNTATVTNTVTQTATATPTAPTSSTPPSTPTSSTPTASSTTTTTATAATTTTTAPPATGFPDATNTGYKKAPGYAGTLPACVTPIKSNTTYKNCHFAGGAEVGRYQGDVVNVSFIGVRFHGTAVEQALVKVWGDNILFDFCTFEPDVAFQPGVRVAYDKSYQYGISAGGSYYTKVGKLTVSNSDFWGFGNAVDLYGSTQTKPHVFRNNWIHDAAADGGGKYHTDGIGTLSGSGTGSYLVLDHNTIESPGNTNGVAFQKGSYSNFTITNNLFGGFGYTVALWAPAPNTTFTGNTFSTRLKPVWGPLYPQAFWTSPGSVWKNNKWSVPAGAAYGNPADNGKFWTPSGPSTTDYQ